MSLVVEQVDAPTDDARALIGELDAELAGPFPPENRHGLSVERVFQPGVLFFVARLDGAAVGCGGVALGDDGFAEVKRMYVRPPARGGNVAAAILARLEDAARSRGVRRLTLETGDVLQAAHRFYERSGFTRCGAFGAYAGMASSQIGRSVFMEKWIA
jgi:putative acetyltransferase